MPRQEGAMKSMRHTRLRRLDSPVSDACPGRAHRSTLGPQRARAVVDLKYVQWLLTPSNQAAFNKCEQTVYGTLVACVRKTRNILLLLEIVTTILAEHN